MVGILHQKYPETVKLSKIDEGAYHPLLMTQLAAASQMISDLTSNKSDLVSVVLMVLSDTLPQYPTIKTLTRLWTKYQLITG